MWYNYRYSKEELESWVPKLKDMSQSTDIYGYFNNHYHGYAPENCIDVLEMLGIATPEQKETRQRISNYRKGRVATKAVARRSAIFLNRKKKIYRPYSLDILRL